MKGDASINKNRNTMVRLAFLLVALKRGSHAGMVYEHMSSVLSTVQTPLTLEMSYDYHDKLKWVWG